MKKISMLLVCLVSFAVPISVFAQTASTHIVFANSQPQYYFDETGIAASQRPFGVECSAIGFTKNTVSWSGETLGSSLQTAYSAQGIWYDQRMVLPTISSLSYFWVGSDVSTSTLDATTIQVKYNQTGMKNMWLGVTDGSRTELANCGNQFINLDPPAPKKILTKENGVEIGY